MFAVVRTGGKQYRVAADDQITVEKLDGDAGSQVMLDVLLVSDGGALQDAGVAKVTAEIVAHSKADKVIIFKKKRRHNYRRKNGHRQHQTVLKILSIA
ncbi:MAG: 50S ribosomal protein L21 [Sandaracinobacteroides sp.]